MFCFPQRALLRALGLTISLGLPFAANAQHEPPASDTPVLQEPVQLGHSDMALALRRHAVALQGGSCADDRAPELGSLAPAAAESSITRSRLLSTQAFLQGEALRCRGSIGRALPFWRAAAAEDEAWTPVVNRRLLAAGEEPLAWPVERGGAGSQRLWSRAIADPHTRSASIGFLLDRYTSGTCTAWLRRQIASVLESVPPADRSEALHAWVRNRVDESDDLAEMQRRLGILSAVPEDRVCPGSPWPSTSPCRMGGLEIVTCCVRR